MNVVHSVFLLQRLAAGHVLLFPHRHTFLPKQPKNTKLSTVSTRCVSIPWDTEQHPCPRQGQAGGVAAERAPPWPPPWLRPRPWLLSCSITASSVTHEASSGEFKGHLPWPPGQAPHVSGPLRQEAQLKGGTEAPAPRQVQSCPSGERRSGESGESTSSSERPGDT